MRIDSLIANQLLMAQTIFALAEHLAASTGYQLTPVTYADLPAEPKNGMIAYITDGAGEGGGVVTGGGTRKAMITYIDGDWIVASTRGVGVVRLGTTTWAELPAAPEQGMLACLTDSNRNGYGQNITASGPYIVLAFYDGTNWVVH